jgi:hypothetical protein
MRMIDPETAVWSLYQARRKDASRSGLCGASSDEKQSAIHGSRKPAGVSLALTLMVRGEKMKEHGEAR